MSQFIRAALIAVVAWTALVADSRSSTTIPLTGGDSLSVVIFEAGVESAYPHWSKDGKRVLFQSNKTGKWQLYTIARDGTDLRRITNDEFNNYMADWSPDNEQIAFVSDRDGNEDVFLMKSDGSEVTNLTRHPSRDIHPYWTNDGKRILFNSSRDVRDGLTIFEMAPDGGKVKRLSTSNDVETCAHLSPDGTRLVYLRAFGGINDEIYVLELATGKTTNVTKSNEGEGWPSWDNSGKRVLFSSRRNGAFCLFAANPDGSGLRQLTQPPGPWYDARAEISPDGDEVVFNRQKDGSIGIVIGKMPKN